MDRLNDDKRADQALLDENNKLAFDNKSLRKEVEYLAGISGILVGMVIVVAMGLCCVLLRPFVPDPHEEVIAELQHKLDAANGAIAGYKIALDLYANAASSATPKATSSWTIRGNYFSEPSAIGHPLLVSSTNRQ